MFSRVFSPSTALENLEEITDNFEETINFEKKIYKKIRSWQWADVVNIYRDHFDQAHKVVKNLGIFSLSLNRMMSFIESE